ncbi:TPA: methyltransferase domain-containing protein [Streptococcus pyogenes]|uniref:class I SAM-dependent methyltransferase n=1 Tax=Streptococcus pyogenes TaxID=1314 RepID=UPI000057BE9D|nr:class I SAM-dependent methyltransferase [Streptococcus pyogenes]EQL81381.1 methyltransferase domain protein [Streptococcus pyogenes UTSW-2]ESA59068.1 methyltransferase domain protein [Streptococcus pyogenes GA40377]HER4570559.1 methyltransferase domain-containing protein [Streptococcus pyogenes NGAS653]HER4724449.1 methyltransferase domain-containing protein [Streptococcus pyogenes NGAS302]HER4731043.1 methyltransferase domain-containing protein [Streptococcus pyogenes NGAS304]HER4783014.1
MVTKEVGHDFLARLGKKRLRPGGVEATNWLIEQGQFSQDCHVLEVACNRCTTAIELAKTFGCQIDAVDLNPKVVKEAQERVTVEGLTRHITVSQANALSLPFPDNHFDIVINEAMLTMLNAKAKEKALNEYWRVLKPGGRLLTHDVAYEDPKTRQVLDELRQTIHVNVAPLSLTGWQALYQEHGFSQVTYHHGKMSLMTPRGMIKDEGLMNTLNIMRRGLKKENRQQFLKMRRFFTRTGKNLCYIAVKSVK